VREPTERHDQSSEAGDDILDASAANSETAKIPARMVVAPIIAVAGAVEQILAAHADDAIIMPKTEVTTNMASPNRRTLRLRISLSKAMP
jgi:hypothetical protein